MVLLASPHWTSHISYEAAAALLPMQSVWAVLMSFGTLATTYNESLEKRLGQICSCLPALVIGPLKSAMMWLAMGYWPEMESIRGPTLL